MEKKKGLLEKLFGKKEKKSSCCCGIELEEVKDEELKNKESEALSKDKGPTCCS